MRFFALEAWRAGERIPALVSAARWEAAAEELLRQRPRCLTATYTEDDAERALRRAAARRRARLIPHLRASAEQALDLAARARVLDYLERAEVALAEDVLAVLAVDDLEHAGEEAAKVRPWRVA